MIRMIKIAVCDDEPAMARELSEHISSYMRERHAGDYRVDSFPGGQALLDSGCEYDLIFLDVRMEQPDGLATARLLRQRNGRSLLVFVTVLKECVFDAFEVAAYDYLLKPLDAGRFGRTMDRALKALERRAADSVLVRRGTACEVVALSQIVYCEVQGRKLYLHLSGGGVEGHYERLDEFERRVDRRFFRCHRSYLVNLDYVRGCRGGRVILPHGEEIPVSRLRERELTRSLLAHMKERGC